MIGDRLHLQWANPVCCHIREFHHIIEETDEEKMYHAYEPQRTERDEAIGDDGAATLLDVFSDDIGKWETDKYKTKEDFIDPKDA